MFSKCFLNTVEKFFVEQSVKIINNVNQYVNQSICQIDKQLSIQIDTISVRECMMH